MENRKGSGIFLGVVSVATLVVAIIGATFAYFSASIEGEGNVDLTAYEFNASLSVNKVYPESAASLIPLDPTATVEGVTGANNTNLLYALNAAENRCIDSKGYQVCALYEATFVNNGSEEITLNGTLTTSKNEAGKVTGATGFKNLKYNTLTGDLDNLALSGTAASVNATVDGTTDIGQVTVAAGETKKVYFVVYLNEAAEDNNSEMGSKFSGKLTYTSATGGQQLTGSFTVTGA